MAVFRAVIWDSTQDENAATASINVADGLPQNGAAGNDQDSLRTIIDDMTIGTVGETSMNTKVTHNVGSDVRPVDPQAQNETRWRVSFTDTVLNAKGSFSIPTANLDLLPAGSEYLDLTAGTGLALKNFLDTNGRSKYGNAINVTSIQFKSV